ncbi:MAG TPA: ATP-dependent helicase, partial [Solirubrobacteraceae bacterium]|nr:ATP-dependent helicase [Solirubrobacteraceae bacterium]
MARALEATTDAWSEAVAHAGGPLVVLGAAGSGKTSLVLARFRWLVERGSMPDRIVLLTPSRGRAQAARARLEEDLTDGYSELLVTTPAQLAAEILRRAGDRSETLDCTLGAGDRLAMLAERIDELSLQYHDFGGNAGALLGGFIRRIDRLKAELIGAEEYATWAAGLPAAAADGEGGPDGALEREFAEVYRAHERMLAEAGARDEGDLVLAALRLVRARPLLRQPYEHVLIDDAQELDLAPASLARAVAGPALTAAGDPLAALHRFRGAGAARMQSFETDDARVVRLLQSRRCPPAIMRAAWALATGGAPSDADETEPAAMHAAGEIHFWRCDGERAQAQSVAADIERLISREGVAPGRIAVLVPAISREGQAVSVALEERAIAHRLIGEAAFFQRAEIRDLLAWLRLLADASDAAAVVRALARPPIELRSIDIARCTQIARRRKLDMVAGLAAAIESPQVPPEARERIRVFLKLYRSGAASIDTMRPDLYVHRLIERLGLRSQQLFAAQPDVVERLRALARFGELASAHVTRSPQATSREFARSIAAVADYGLREREEPQLDGVAAAAQVLAFEDAGGLEVDHVYALGLSAGLNGPATAAVPDALLHEPLPGGGEEGRERALRQRLYVALTRARTRAVLTFAAAGERGAAIAPSPLVEDARVAAGADWEDRDEELFGPAEALHSTYRLLRDELLEGTIRAGGRLAELR